MNNSDQKLWEYYQNENAAVFSSTHDRHNRVARNVYKFVRNTSAQILEIGFGDGYLLKKLSKSYNCFGADLSSDVVEKMSREVLAVDFKTIGVDGIMPYENNFFDGFIASEVLEHMSDSELTQSIKEMGRILKKGAYAFITFPADENLKENECFCPNCGANFHRWGHKQSWNKKKIMEKFSDFETIQVGEYFVRFEGSNLFERVFGYIFYIARNIVNIFKKLPNRSYSVILRKK